LLLAYILIPELRDRWWTLLLFLALIGATCLTTTSVGLLCSSLSRRTPVAMVMTYLVLLVLFIGPVGLVWYLQGYTDLPEERLASLTVTSPFAAAFSIPIPSSDDGKPYTPSFLGSTTLEVPGLSGLRVPIWAAYLAISPVLMLVLNGLTYIAFRLRWWRAGMTI
jgi:ABC-type transport system involved in multi-copper enzyme maturation permease subunit